MQDPKGAKVLTLEHLSGGFVVWLISATFATTFAIFVYFFEWIGRLITNIVIETFYIQKYLKLVEMRTQIESKYALIDVEECEEEEEILKSLTSSPILTRKKFSLRSKLTKLSLKRFVGYYLRVKWVGAGNRGTIFRLIFN